MPFQSVDKIQKVLQENIFHYAKDSKKAAGRSLGTIVEIITYYLLKTWGLNNNISIERKLEEYGNSDITHNVEYSLHPELLQTFITVDKSIKGIKSRTIIKELEKRNYNLKEFEPVKNDLLSNEILRNACTIGVSETAFLLCSIKTDLGDKFELHVYEQSRKPYAMVECKRVGVEEGMSKGPQTIEKAKQGAYVARTTSSLQKLRTDTGEIYGIIYKSNNEYIVKPYVELMEEIIYSDDTTLLKKFILTVGVVSNHGNWFKRNSDGIVRYSNDIFEKELKVLAQSYDWLLFLTDEGLSEFVENLLLNPKSEFDFIRETFQNSYSGVKGKNQFTKVKMNIKADELLLKYFQNNIDQVESWFKVISPAKTLAELKSELQELSGKDWTKILQ